MREASVAQMICPVMMALVALAGCGGGSATPIAPTPPGPAAVSVSLGSSPPKPTFINTSGTTWRFQLDANIILTASPGSGARINQITTTVTSRRDIQNFTTTVSASLSTGADISIPPGGTMTYAHAQVIAVDSDSSSASWSFTVSGIDSRGVTFTAASPELVLDLSTAR